MRYSLFAFLLAGSAFALGSPVVLAQGQTASAPQVAPASGTPTPGQTSPNSLVVYFDFGSAALTPKDNEALDQASRLYRAGHPILMVVSGYTDTAGSAEYNLELSLQRANTVLHELVARGIPADKFHIVADGETDLAVPTPQGVSDPANRRVVVSWR